MFRSKALEVWRQKPYLICYKQHGAHSCQHNNREITTSNEKKNEVLVFSFHRLLCKLLVGGFERNTSISTHFQDCFCLSTRWDVSALGGKDNQEHAALHLNFTVFRNKSKALAAFYRIVMNFSLPIFCIFYTILMYATHRYCSSSNSRT